jgi:prophage antirepressor-like protein
MSDSLELVRQAYYSSLLCDFWKDNKDEIVMTREQIGQALGYKNPKNSIKDIHNRNKDRLDKFSTERKLSQVEGNRVVSRDIVVYNLRGIFEICRFSKQPKANEFMDWVWDVIETIMKTGKYAVVDDPRFMLAKGETNAEAVFATMPKDLDIVGMLALLNKFDS